MKNENKKIHFCSNQNESAEREKTKLSQIFYEVANIKATSQEEVIHKKFSKAHDLLKEEVIRLIFLVGLAQKKFEDFQTRSNKEELYELKESKRICVHILNQTGLLSTITSEMMFYWENLGYLTSMRLSELLEVSPFICDEADLHLCYARNLLLDTLKSMTPADTDEYEDEVSLKDAETVDSMTLGQILQEAPSVSEKASLHFLYALVRITDEFSQHNLVGIFS